MSTAARRRRIRDGTILHVERRSWHRPIISVDGVRRKDIERKVREIRREQ